MDNFERRGVLTWTLSLLAAASVPSIALAQARPPRPPPPRRPTARPQSNRQRQRGRQFTNKPVRARQVSTTFGRQNASTVRSGASIMRRTTQRSAQTGAHPNRHRPLSRVALKKRADERMRKIQQKRSRGETLSARDQRRLENGVTYSSFYSKDIMHQVVGRAEIQARGILRQGETPTVRVRSDKPIGMIYNTKTQRYVEGKTAVVVFNRDSSGAIVQTMYVAR